MGRFRELDESECMMEGGNCKNHERDGLKDCK